MLSAADSRPMAKQRTQKVGRQHIKAFRWFVRPLVRHFVFPLSRVAPLTVLLVSVVTYQTANFCQVTRKI
jgi:hypothetical protein